jgi:hypothetical protein
MLEKNGFKRRRRKACWKLMARLLKPETPVYHNKTESLSAAALLCTDVSSLYTTIGI